MSIPRNPVIKVRFTGLMVFQQENDRMRVRVYRGTQDHELRILIIRITDGTTEIIPLPQSAANYDMDMFVTNSAFQGIRTHTANDANNYNRILNFKTLTPRHASAQPKENMFHSIVFHDSLFFCANLHPAGVGPLGSDCDRREQRPMAFVIGANIYFTPFNGEATLHYRIGLGPDNEKTVSMQNDGSDYEVYITNLPPQNTPREGDPSHFQHYYNAFDFRLPMGPQDKYDVCGAQMSMRSQRQTNLSPQYFINYAHPCIPIGI